MPLAGRAWRGITTCQDFVVCNNLNTYVQIYLSNIYRFHILEKRLINGNENVLENYDIKWKNNSMKYFNL